MEIQSADFQNDLLLRLTDAAEPGTPDVNCEVAVDGEREPELPFESFRGGTTSSGSVAVTHQLTEVSQRQNGQNAGALCSLPFSALASSSVVSNRVVAIDAKEDKKLLKRKRATSEKSAKNCRTDLPDNNENTSININVGPADGMPGTEQGANMKQRALAGGKLSMQFLPVDSATQEAMDRDGDANLELSCRIETKKTMAYVLRHVFKRCRAAGQLLIPGSGLQFAVHLPPELQGFRGSFDMKDQVAEFFQQLGRPEPFRLYYALLAPDQADFTSLPEQSFNPLVLPLVPATGSLELHTIASFSIKGAPSLSGAAPVLPADMPRHAHRENGAALLGRGGAAPLSAEPVGVLLGDGAVRLPEEGLSEDGLPEVAFPVELFDILGEEDSLEAPGADAHAACAGRLGGEPEGQAATLLDATQPAAAGAAGAPAGPSTAATGGTAAASGQARCLPPETRPTAVVAAQAEFSRLPALEALIGGGDLDSNGPIFSDEFYGHVTAQMRSSAPVTFSFPPAAGKGTALGGGGGARGVGAAGSGQEARGSLFSPAKAVSTPELETCEQSSSLLEQLTPAPRGPAQSAGQLPDPGHSTEIPAVGFSAVLGSVLAGKPPLLGGDPAAKPGVLSDLGRQWKGSGALKQDPVARPKSAGTVKALGLAGKGAGGAKPAFMGFSPAIEAGEGTCDGFGSWAGAGLPSAVGQGSVRGSRDPPLAIETSLKAWDPVSSQGCSASKACGVPGATVFPFQSRQGQGLSTGAVPAGGAATTPSLPPPAAPVVACSPGAAAAAPPSEAPAVASGSGLPSGAPAGGAAGGQGKGGASKRRGGKAAPAACKQLQTAEELPAAASGAPGSEPAAAPPPAPQRSLRPRKLLPGAMEEETLAAPLSAAISPSDRTRPGSAARPSRGGTGTPAVRAAPLLAPGLAGGGGLAAGAPQKARKVAAGGRANAAGGCGKGTEEPEAMDYDWLDCVPLDTSMLYPEDMPVGAPPVPVLAEGLDGAGDAALGPGGWFVGDSFTVHPDFDVHSLMTCDEWLVPGGLKDFGEAAGKLFGVSDTRS